MDNTQPRSPSADETRDLFVGKLPIGYADVAMEVAGSLIAERDMLANRSVLWEQTAMEQRQRAEQAEAERDHWHRRATGIDGKIAEAVTARADWRERCLNAERERDRLREADARVRALMAVWQDPDGAAAYSPELASMVLAALDGTDGGE